MKLGTKDIAGFLAAPLKRAKGTLIYGADEGMVRERAQIIVKAVLGDQVDPFALVELDGDGLKADPARLFDELYALSLMGGQRLVWVRNAHDGLGGMLEDLEESKLSAYLLVTAEGLSPKSSLRSWFEHSDIFAALPCYADESRDLEGLISQHFRQAGVACDRESMHYLTSQLGNDRMVTRSELDKLVLYAGDAKRLTLADMEAVTGGNAALGYDDMTRAVAGGDLKLLRRTLDMLFSEGEQPVGLVRILLKHFEKLYTLQGHCEQGLSEEQAIAKLRPPVFFKQQPLLRAQLGKWPRKKIARAMAYLIRTERSLKSFVPDAQLICARHFEELARSAA